MVISNGTFGMGFCTIYELNAERLVIFQNGTSLFDMRNGQSSLIELCLLRTNKSRAVLPRELLASKLSRARSATATAPTRIIFGRL